MKVLGIDPGVSGAVALLDIKGGTARVLDVRDMPTCRIARSDNKVRRRVDPAALLVLLRATGARQAFVEHVHASPGMGVSSAFTFGHTAGVIEATCAAAGIDMRLCQPTAWKRGMGVPADKDAARGRASAMLGLDAASTWWPLKKHHNRAEAALLGLYGARVSGTVPCQDDARMAT